MATQTQIVPGRMGPLAQLRQLWDRYPAAAGIAFVAIAIGFLSIINRNFLLFPLWSSIAFPMLAVSPFVIFGLKMPGRLKVALVLLVVLIVVPLLGFSDGFYLELAIQIGIYGTLALGLNIVIGFAGLLDLGYIAFFAVGAYLWGVFASTGGNTIIVQSNALAAPGLFWLFILGGIGLAALFGIMLGLPVMRLRGDYLAIVTLGFGEMIRILVSNLNNVSSDPAVTINITNGAEGLPGIASPPLPPFLFSGIQGIAKMLPFAHVNNPQAFTYQLFFYGLVVLIAAVAVLVATRLDNSAIGRAWTAIREDEIAARAMGVPLVKMKLMAFAMGASFAGAMGTIYAAKQTFVSPESFSFNQSIFIVVIVIVGGMGSIRGVLTGAVAVTLLNLQILPNFSLLINSFKNDSTVAPWIQSVFQAWPAQLEVAKYQRFVFGILLVLMMIFRPAGLVP
ncbi:MAG TPA: hypothetical protein VKQ72_04360, partial [Aggregatilineales bacterium]|nr:hypothetical protein [Aggregatilineales bacterium]